MKKEYLDERQSLDELQFLDSWEEPRSFDDSFILCQELFLYTHVSYFSSVKLNLMVLYLFRLNWCNLSLLAEDNNGSEQQGF